MFPSRILRDDFILETCLRGYSMSLPISNRYSNIMRCRQAWRGMSGTLNSVLFFSPSCVSIPNLENMGFWVQIRLRYWLSLTLSNLLNFIVFICSSENKRDNADASIEWRLISFWSAEINRWKALSGNYFVCVCVCVCFLRGIYRCGWIKENLLSWTTGTQLWLRVGEEIILLLSKNPKLSPPNSNGESCFFVILKGWEIMQSKRARRTGE